MVIELADRPLTLFDTPGHARHHHCVWDERSQGFFTGDTFGLSYREFDTPQGVWLLPTTTPTQFDPEALRASIERMLARQPQRMYLTHYGCIGNVAALGRELLDQLEAVVALGERTRPQALVPTERHAALTAGLTTLYLQQLQRLGSTLPREQVIGLLAMDIELNAQGMAGWLDTAHQF
jgi:glyoxylase-like metal-dependent hydrolase (beta-lactamase superfamily II)